jgi:F0F1-type ATP synthase assembly protein I
MDKKGKGDNPWRAAGLVGAMGADMAVCVALGYFLGSRLGGTPGWVVFGVLAGLAAGIMTCVMLVRAAMRDGDG